MLNTVVGALKALPVRWFGLDPVSDPRTLSHKAFVMELTLLDSKIFAWVHETPFTTPLDRRRLKFNLFHDLEMNEAECHAVLDACEAHYAITFSDFDRHRLIKRGPNVTHLHSVAKQSARRRDLYAAS